MFCIQQMRKNHKTKKYITRRETYPGPWARITKQENYVTSIFFNAKRYKYKYTTVYCNITGGHEPLHH